MGQKVHSVITNDLNHCFVCGTPNDIQIHHIFGGCDRPLSTEDGLIVPLCYEHHLGKNGVHYNKDFMDELHQVGQFRWQELHPDQEFHKRYRKNYL